MNSQPYEVLFLGTRSIIAQANPDGKVHPYTLAALADQGIPIDGLSSKSWHVFGNPRAPVMDLVITVCDATGQETLPQWPG